MSVGVNGAVRFTYFDELLRNLGGIPANRVRLDPAPGTATVRDLIRLWKSEGRMCELVDKTLVAKPMAFDESNIAGLILTWLNNYLADHPLGMAVGEQGMNGFADPAVIAVCSGEGRILVTLDTDFMDIRQYPPTAYPGIIVLRPHRQVTSRFLSLMVRAAGLLDQEAVVGKLWIVDEGRIRIRPDDGGI